MGILSKLFSSKGKGPALTAGPEVRDLPSSPARDILIRIYNGPTKEDERPPPLPLSERIGRPLSSPRRRRSRAVELAI